MATKLLEGKASIEKAISSIAGRGKKLDNDIQLCGLSILAHVDKHGDVTLATRLVQAMPKSSRTNALKEWFEAFGKLAWDTKEKIFTYAKGKETRMAEAEKAPFWEFQPEKPYVPFDLKAALDSLLKRAAKAAKENEISAEQLSMLDKFSTDVLALDMSTGEVMDMVNAEEAAPVAQ